MKHYKKTALALSLSALLLLYAVIPAFAAGTPSEKEEVIYAKLSADGAVQEVFAVNIFGKGDIIDYGSYSQVEMLNTTDRITTDGDRISFSSSAERVYYKGTMNSPELPWEISIRFFMDGQEYSPQEIAGKSGSLKIQFRVTENTACGGDFFRHYALQASFTLDTKKCTNITAADATIANVGSKKQISYTMLPGEGLDATITAHVQDFEMSSVSINGVPLSMNLEVEDQELMAQVNELLEAIEKLDDGTGQLKNGLSELENSAADQLQPGVNALTEGVAKLHDGAGALREGSGALQDGTGALKDGAARLKDGVQSMNDGMALLYQGLTELNTKSGDLVDGSGKIKGALLAMQSELSAVSTSSEELSQLVLGSSQIKAGLDALYEGAAALQENTGYAAYQAAMLQNGLNIDELQAANTQTAATLMEQIEGLMEQAAYLEQTGGDQGQIAQLRAAAQQLSGVVTLLQGNNAALGGTEVYLGQLRGGVDALTEGLAQMQESYAALDSGIQTLATQLKGLLVGMTQLKAGIDTLVTEYTKLDTGIGEYTGGVARILAGYSALSSGMEEVLTGSSALEAGTSELYGKTGELLRGISELYKGTGTLKTSTGQLDSGVAELLSGIVRLNSGAAELKDGTTEMRSETTGMDTEISDKIDEMIESITGGSVEAVSFVSEKNTNVEAVQFVLQTEEVKTAEAEAPAPTVKEELTFWQKILRLFGLY